MRTTENFRASSAVGRMLGPPPESARVDKAPRPVKNNLAALVGVAVELSPFALVVAGVVGTLVALGAAPGVAAGVGSIVLGAMAWSDLRRASP